MFNPTRRNIFKACLAGAAVAPFSSLAAASSASAKACASAATTSSALAQQIAWARGIEGQRKADLGNGTFRNPIIGGDHPDPTILKDGENYYMTFSSFNSYPGIVIWHSTDLVNWAPLGAALQKNIGTVWALDLCKHNVKPRAINAASMCDK